MLRTAKTTTTTATPARAPRAQDATLYVRTLRKGRRTFRIVEGFNGFYVAGEWSVRAHAFKGATESHTALTVGARIVELQGAGWRLV